MENNDSFFSFQEHFWFPCSPQRTHRCCFVKFLIDCSQIFHPGQRWTLATSLDAFAWHTIISSCNLLGFLPAHSLHIVLDISSSNGKEFPSYTMTKGYREWGNNFLAGPVSVHLNSVWTHSIHGECKIYCSCTVLSRSVPAEQVLWSLYKKQRSDLEFLVHFSWSHYVLTAFVPHMHYRTQQIYVSQEFMRYSQGLPYYLLYRAPCPFRG